MITDRPQTICAWCGHLAAPEASSETLCGLTCHDQDCLSEHTRECEMCLSTSSRMPRVGMVTHLFWECRCEEAISNPITSLIARPAKPTATKDRQREYKTYCSSLTNGDWNLIWLPA
jgi:hypothetical protein